MVRVSHPEVYGRVAREFAIAGAADPFDFGFGSRLESGVSHDTEDDGGGSWPRRPGEK